jgi:lipopolysaccharide biosynthesis glycosyltransferase
MKLLITTRADDTVKYLSDLTHPVFREYAKYCNADFMILDHEPPVFSDDNMPHFRIMKHYELHEEYDRILHLDTDIIINTNAPNIFEVVPEEKIGCILEDWGREERIKDRREMIKSIQEEWDDIGWKEKYINSGVLLTSKIHKDIYQPFEGKYWTGDGSDDIHMGYMIKNLNHEIFELPYQFNHTGTYSEAWNGSPNRLDSFFLHYAGSRGIKDDLFRDYDKIYGDNIEAVHQRTGINFKGKK